jgi:hypothetical protein
MGEAAPVMHGFGDVGGAESGAVGAPARSAMLRATLRMR